jgi:hypothetical protein
MVVSAGVSENASTTLLWPDFGDIIGELQNTTPMSEAGSGCGSALPVLPLDDDVSRAEGGIASTVSVLLTSRAGSNDSARWPSDIFAAC